VWKEGVLEFCKRNPKAPCNKRYKWYSFVSQVWDAVFLAFRYAGINPTVEWKTEFLSAIMADPERLAEDIKKSASHARSEVFSRVESFENRFTFLHGASDIQKLRYSMVGRALPAPLSFDSDAALEQYFARMCSTPADLEGFTDWLNLYLDRFRPKKLLHYGFTIGTAACAELPRWLGGKAAVFSSIVEIGRRRFSHSELNQLFDAPDLVIPNVTLEGCVGGGNKELPSSPTRKLQWDWRYLMAGSLIVCEKMQAQGLIPMSYIIVAPEKGLKTRLPTAGIAPIVALQHLLRTYIDQFMANDPRIGPSITPGDAFRNPIGEPGGGRFLRSVDATTATDLHPFELQRGIYKALLRDYLPQTTFFQRLYKLLDFICGPRVLLDERPQMYPLPDYPRKGVVMGNLNPSEGSPLPIRQGGFSGYLTQFKHDYNLAHPDWDEPGGRPELRTPLTGPGVELAGSYVWQKPYEENPIPADPEWRPDLLEFVMRYHQSYQEDGPISTVGAMMGEPTSWPGLAILNVWAWEQSVPLERWGELRTTGDDALGLTTEDESALLTQNLEKAGVVISSTKDYESEDWGLFTEVITDRFGDPAGVNPISTLVGPFGGSKGSVNWAACPLHTLAVVDRVHGFPFSKRVWKASRFAPDWAAASSAGLPLGFPPGWGGISLPPLGFPNLKGKRLRQWGYLVGHTSRKDLILRGTGLALSKNPRFGPTFRETVRMGVESTIRANAPRLFLNRMLKTVDSLTDASVEMLFLPKYEGGKLSTVPLEDGISVHADAFIKAIMAVKATNLLLQGHLPPAGERAPAVFHTADTFLRRIRKLPSGIPVRKGVRSLIARKDEERTNAYFSDAQVCNPLKLWGRGQAQEDLEKFPPPREYPEMRYRR